ncbi:MAG: mechanosensitive ion channel family protein [Kiritimatiellia bacterium]
MFADAVVEPGVTNVLDTAKDVAVQVGSQVTEVLCQQTSQGRELFQQMMGWLTQNGISFAINVFCAAMILLLGGLVVKGLVGALRRALGRSKRVDELLRTFLCSVASKTGWALLVVVALGRLGVEVGPLVASIGVTGVVLGFAFKESLGSLAAGLMIALNHPFKVGEYVVVGGTEGVVTELNMMATVLVTADNKKVTVPNSSVWGSAITNFSALGTRRVDTKVGVAYGTDLRQAVAVIREAVKAVPGVLPDPEPTVAVAGLDDSAVTINVRPWAAAADYWSVHSGVQVAVNDALAQAGIEIPFPQVEVHTHDHGLRA